MVSKVCKPSTGLGKSGSTCILPKVNKRSKTKTVCQYFNKTLLIGHPALSVCDTAVYFYRV